MNQTFCNTRVEPEEELEQCPYDPVHRILPKRMQTHLIKCRKAILGQPTSPYYQRAVNMVICKFNTKHHVQKEELDAHHRKCADKKEFLQHTIQTTSSDDPQKKPGWMNLIDDTILKQKPAGNEENWEDEWQQTYDPMEKIDSNTNIIYNPQGLSKAKKRDYAFNRRLQAENFNQEDWAEEAEGAWDTDEYSKTTIRPTSQSPKSEMNADWKDEWQGENKKRNDSGGNFTSSKPSLNGNKYDDDNKVPNKEKYRKPPTKNTDGWTEVPPRFRAKLAGQKENNGEFGRDNSGWENDDGGWGDTGSAIKSVPHEDSKSNGQTVSASNGDSWGNDQLIPIPKNSQQHVVGILDNVDDDGGWGNESTSINPYLQQYQNPQSLDADEGWEGEEYIPPPPPHDPWGTVTVTSESDALKALKDVQLEQEKVETEENMDQWGGRATDCVAPVSLSSAIKPLNNQEDVIVLNVNEESSKLSDNARNFAPPGFPPNSKFAQSSPPILPLGHKAAADNPHVSTDPSTLTENESEDSEQNTTNFLSTGPPLVFQPPPPSETGSSEISVGPGSGDNNNEDNKNTFSHEAVENKKGGKTVNIEREENRKKSTVDISAQQEQTYYHHRHSKTRRRAGGRRKKEIRSKSNDKKLDKLADTPSTGMAVKCLVVTIVAALFVTLYYLILMVLLSLNNK